MLSIDWSLLFTIINLIIFYLLMKKFLFGPIAKIMAQRDELIKKQFNEAKDRKNEAEELFNQYTASLSEASDEGEKILQEARGEAREEYSRIVDEANKKAEEIVSKAKQNADAEYQKAVSGAYKKISAIAGEATEKMMQGGDVYDEFLSKVGNAKGNK